MPNTKRIVPEASKRILTAVLQIHNNTTCVLVCEKHGKYFLPGGKLEAGETPWVGMKREFQEEVERPLPRLLSLQTHDGRVEVPRIDYGYPEPHTRMYCSYVDGPLRGEYEHRTRNGEVDRTLWVDIRVVRLRDFEWAKEFMRRSWQFLDTNLIQDVFRYELNIRV